MKPISPCHPRESGDDKERGDDKESGPYLLPTQIAQQITGAAPQHGVDPPRRDIEQWHQNERPFVGPRMRQHRVGRRSHQTTVLPHRDDIQVQRAGGIRLTPDASLPVLDCLQCREQDSRVGSLNARFNLKDRDRVDVVRLSGRRDGCGAIPARQRTQPQPR